MYFQTPIVMVIYFKFLESNPVFLEMRPDEAVRPVVSGV